MVAVPKIKREGKMQKKHFLAACSKKFFFTASSIAFCILFAGVNIAFLNPLVQPAVLTTQQQPISIVPIPSVSGPAYECVLAKNSDGITIVVSGPADRCVLTKNSCGWGNNVLIFLYSELREGLLRESRHNNGETAFTSKPMLPCVCGSFGVVLGKLFRNVEQCPPGTECTPERCYRKENASKTFSDVRAFNLQELPKFPSLLELNATFVDQIFALAGVSFTLKDLRTSSCAVQIRFGDAYIRDPTDSRHSKQARACKDSDRNGASCFDKIADRVLKLCPNPRVPIYLATDFPEFTRYFCSREQAANSNVTFLSSCHEKDLVSEGKHINDIALPFEAYSLDELEEDVRSVVVTIVSDWLALALAQRVYGIGGSTFRESASYEYFVK
jgi:hypothetical protein